MINHVHVRYLSVPEGAGFAQLGLSFCREEGEYHLHSDCPCLCHSPSQSLGPAPDQSYRPSAMNESCKGM